MIYLDDRFIETFEKKYGIESSFSKLPRGTCAKCEELYCKKKAFRCKDYCGIEYSCERGCDYPKYTALTMIATSKEKIAEWDYIFGAL